MDRETLNDEVQRLIELNEPEAIIRTLKRAAAAKAGEAAKGTISAAEAKRWSALADALAEVESRIAS